MDPISINKANHYQTTGPFYGPINYNEDILLDINTAHLDLWDNCVTNLRESLFGLVLIGLPFP